MDAVSVSVCSRFVLVQPSLAEPLARHLHESWPQRSNGVYGIANQFYDEDGNHLANSDSEL